MAVNTLIVGRNVKAKFGSAKGESTSLRPDGLTPALYVVPTISTSPELASCVLCLMCWKADRIGIVYDFCSDQCRGFADKRAPLLFEVPRGHVAFKEGKHIRPLTLNSLFILII